MSPPVRATALLKPDAIATCCSSTDPRNEDVRGATAIVMPLSLLQIARGSDHADTPDNAANPGQDLTDVYVFPSPSDSNNVVLAMNVSPLITPAQIGTRRFDPNVLYQFKIDNTGDNIEDLVI